jgi:small nuclear ribonucleoprotein D2
MEEGKKEVEQEETFHEGPLSVLKECVKSNTQIMVYCRNNRKLLGKIRAFDRHMNMILESVFELWTETLKGKGKVKKARTKNNERHIPKMFLRGDSVILVIKNPNKTKVNDPIKEKEKEKEKDKDKERKDDINMDEIDTSSKKGKSKFS